ncbi:nicotinate-nucleotide adenylyltransferase [Flavivirga rizhaonensis]|uniref:Nicotinate-nucleotide adenylyltransferase n=1 Tax=Flavivirga rizhaonensis TaxID=2559571 RepID=A0A4S1E1V9_9FLAO|nr:nicotinate-nucleotide adenylyltransferase [Flavivirga rizhaonensis]TGV04355.1 nicotinate-nucleotide adenylyltransferase [Flavivirga rizhaonensis]
MKKLMFNLFLLGLTTQVYAQNPETFSAVYIVHNYKYLSDVNSKEVAMPVEELHLKVSDFNVKELDIYADEYDLYDVYFVIPEGKILASYDKDSNLLRTIERYKNINLPSSVFESVAKKFPNWSISKNAYLVNYHNSGKIKKLYKLTLENGNKRIKIKVNDNGDFQ